MPTHLDQHIRYDEDHLRNEPTNAEPLSRRYGWSVLLYVTFGALIILLFLAVR